MLCQGMSRSAALVVALLGCNLSNSFQNFKQCVRRLEGLQLERLWTRYVMEKFNLPSDQAHTYVLTRRHCISINEGFRNQIRHQAWLSKRRFFIETDSFHALTRTHGTCEPREYEMLHRVGSSFMSRGHPCVWSMSTSEFILQMSSDLDLDWFESR